MIDCITTDMIVPMSLGILATLAFVGVCIADSVSEWRERRRKEKFFAALQDARLELKTRKLNGEQK